MSGRNTKKITVPDLKKFIEEIMTDADHGTPTSHLAVLIFPFTAIEVETIRIFVPLNKNDFEG